MKKLSTMPPKGTEDWLPKRFAISKYIFDVYRNVCVEFGFEEYQTPIFEYADIFRAKSGEDVGGPELWTFFDRANREYAIRPEMTPPVSRLVSKVYQSEAKPIKWFSIGNFVRNQKPQRGRGREFWALNYDIFGDNSVYSDLEVLLVSLNIMKKFGAPKNSFTLQINNRRMIDGILKEASLNQEEQTQVIRTLDKWDKLDRSDIFSKFTESGLETKQIDYIEKFMESKSGKELLQNIPQIESNVGYVETVEIIDKLNALGFDTEISFAPNVIRGYDYYDGMIFEMFDNNPLNRRSMFGGGRYNGLGNLFMNEGFPATGAAPGEPTMYLYLESWGLLPNKNEYEILYLPILDKKFDTNLLRVAEFLRKKGYKVINGFKEEDLSNALRNSAKKQYKYLGILMEDEVKKNLIRIKDLKSGKESILSIL